MNSSFPQESAKIINLPEPRTKGKMSLEEGLVHRDILDAHDVFLIVTFDDPVHQQERIPMRQ